MNPAWYVLLWGPRRIERRLAALEAQGLVEQAPSLWQVWLGVLYMWTRVLRRPETIGLSDGAPVRDTPGARRLQHRLPRLVALLRTRSVNPLDQVGLGSSTPHVMRHLLGAYHPGDNALYDLTLLHVEDGALEALRDALVAVLDGRHPQATLLQDLCVYEGYHARLLAMVEAWLEEGPGGVELVHPDTTLRAFMAWCASQPDGPVATLRALGRGTLTLQPDA
ncbi:MAG: hypothetical protein H6732_16715 [Alphaproteobacteria bacterium]|nr:hypothetical protein [Alphaproteobacteria bacterium]